MEFGKPLAGIHFHRPVTENGFNLVTPPLKGLLGLFHMGLYEVVTHYCVLTHKHNQ